jgi:ABC-2 type transport system ATP-binding protein
MIDVRDLRIDYGGVCAVRDLSLAVGAGEIYGLIGANGAGKTSTMRALAGLLQPTYGEIRVGGIDVREHREAANRLLGFMPDQAPLYEDLTVGEYLDLWAASYRVPRAERGTMVARCLERVDLAAKRDALTGTLSRGMKQRLMLARALLPEPLVVLLDEPANGMDPHGRAFLKEMVRQLGHAGKTVVLSSHILAELSHMCTSAGIMRRGRMVVSGRVDAVTASVLGRAKITAEVTAGLETLQRLLGADPRVSGLRREGPEVEFTFAGDAEAAGELLAALCAAGVRMANFARKKQDLEEVFLRVGGTA